MSQELKIQRPVDNRPEYISPRVMRLGDGHLGAGVCTAPGSSDTGPCGTGNSAGAGCGGDGNTPGTFCDNTGSGV